MRNAILVIGSTGKQGGAVIEALLSAPESLDVPILAVTRNTGTAGAQSLLAKSPRIKLVKGNLNNCDAIFKAAEVPVKSVFFVPIPAMAPGAKADSEEVQGKALVDAAVQNDVEHFVFSSVDRHGSDSESSDTDVPHFIAKARIEKHLQQKAGTSMTWTILRPVAFMDNITTGFAGKIFPTVSSFLLPIKLRSCISLLIRHIKAWKVGLTPTKKLQLIAAEDIGWFGAQALLRPKEYAGRGISLAGDELTFEEANGIFKKKFGTDIATTFGFVASGLLWAVDDVGKMFKFFEETGYAADIAGLRKEHPELLSFEKWLDTSVFAHK